MEQGKYFFYDNRLSGTGRYHFRYKSLHSDKGTKHPIFVTFSGDRIEFFINGYLIKKNAETIADKIYYYDDQISLLTYLHLHPDKETSEELEENLKELFERKFPLLDELSIVGILDDKRVSSNERKKNFKDLKIFNENNKQHYDHQPLKGIFLFYKNLLLDFLFDLTFSEVFQKDPHFDKILHLFKTSRMLKAIQEKAKFYYYIENYQLNENFNLNNNKYFEILTKQGENWFEILKEENIDKVIDPKKKWFFDVEAEVNFACKEIDKIGAFKNGYKNGNLFTKFIDKKKIQFLDWFIERNNIESAWMLFDWYKLILSVFFVFLSFFLPYIVLKINNTEFYFQEIIVNIGIFLITLLILFFLDNFVNLRKIQLFKFRGTLIKQFLIPLWALIVGTSLVTEEFSSYFNKLLINSIWLHKIGFIFYVSFSYIIAFKLLFYFTNFWKLKSFRAIIISGYILNLICLFIFYQIPFIWVTLVFIIMYLVFIILYINEKENHQTLSHYTRLNKVLTMFFYGFMISLTVNLFIYSFLYKKYLEEYHFVGQVYTELSKEKEENKGHKNYVKYDGNLDHEKGKELMDTIEKQLTQHISERTNVYIDEEFYEGLEYVWVVDNNNKPVSPIIKNVSILGLNFKTIPGVIYINSLISLLLTVIIQIVLHKRKFLIGGSAE